MGCGASTSTSTSTPPPGAIECTERKYVSGGSSAAAVPTQRRVSKDAVRRNSIKALQVTGLQQEELEALVDSMSIAEMVHATARVNARKRVGLRSAVRCVATAGLTIDEADALTTVLSQEELAATAARLGLPMSDEVKKDPEEVRRRASICLQQPLRLTPAVQQDASGDEKELQARIVSLESLASLCRTASQTALPEVLEDADWDDAAPPAAMDDATAAPAMTDDTASAPAAVEFGGFRFEHMPSALTNSFSALDDFPMTLMPFHLDLCSCVGGLRWSPSILDEFMLTGEHPMTATDDDWQGQLLLMYNMDREANGLPPLEDGGVEAAKVVEEASSALGRPLQRATTRTWGSWRADLEEHVAAVVDATVEGLTSAWDAVAKTWRASGVFVSQAVGAAGAPLRVAGTVAADGTVDVQPPAPPKRTESVEFADEYAAFFAALPPGAQEVLTDLYSMGLLSKHDPIARQARYVKAVGTAYDGDGGGAAGAGGLRKPSSTDGAYVSVYKQDPTRNSNNISKRIEADKKRRERQQQTRATAAAGGGRAVSRK